MSMRLFLMHVILAARLANAYDRCDDLCRVFGYVEGGKCEVSNDETHCICQPGDQIGDAFMSGICDE